MEDVLCGIATAVVIITLILAVWSFETKKMTLISDASSIEVRRQYILDSLKIEKGIK